MSSGAFDRSYLPDRMRELWGHPELRMGYVSAQIASGTLEVAAESGAKVADAVGGPVAQAVFKTDGAPSESGGPPAGLQVFISTLGLFAVPVVAWSLYTLNTTGAPRSPLYSIKIAGWTTGCKNREQQSAVADRAFLLIEAGSVLLSMFTTLMHPAGAPYHIMQRNA